MSRRRLTAVSLICCLELFDENGIGLMGRKATRAIAPPSRELNHPPVASHLAAFRERGGGNEALPRQSEQFTHRSRKDFGIGEDASKQLLELGPLAVERFTPGRPGDDLGTGEEG